MEDSAKERELSMASAALAQPIVSLAQTARSEISPYERHGRGDSAGISPILNSAVTRAVAKCSSNTRASDRIGCKTTQAVCEQQIRAAAAPGVWRTGHSVIGWRKQPRRTGAGHPDDIRGGPKSQRSNSTGTAACVRILQERERRDRRAKTTRAAREQCSH